MTPASNHDLLTIALAPHNIEKFFRSKRPATPVTTLGIYMLFLPISHLFRSPYFYLSTMVHSWDTSSIFSFSFSGLPLRLGFCFSIFFLRLLEGTSKEESSRNSPQLKMKDLQEVSSQSKRKSLEAPPNEPHVERKHATSPLVPKQGSSIIISEVQKGGRVRAPSPSESLIPNFMGFTQGTTYIGSDPAGSPPFVPQGEGISDRLTAWFSDPIARLWEFFLAELLPHPPHPKSIIPTAAHFLAKFGVISL